MDNYEVGIPDEARYPVCDALMNARFTRDLLFRIAELPECLVTLGVRAKNSVSGILPAALRADYQIRALMLALLTIGSPSLHPNALANSGMFDSGPLTRKRPGECGSV